MCEDEEVTENIHSYNGKQQANGVVYNYALEMIIIMMRKVWKILLHFMCNDLDDFRYRMAIKEEMNLN